MNEDTTKTVSDSPLRKLFDDLKEEWGIAFGCIRTLILILANRRWHSPTELIREAALSHRAVTRLLHRLHPWLEEADGSFRMHDDVAAGFTALFARETASHFPDPYEEAARAHPALSSMTRTVEEAPRSNRNLDHVSATPVTALKRALFLTDRYELEGAEILCLGDHDLTSLALAHIAPDLAITVVDIDERILSHIDTCAQKRGWNIGTLFADLRLELPRSATGRFDLVFTDPPYTPAGIRLFLQRAIAALKRTGQTRILLSYGFGEGHPSLGYQAQSVLHELRLVQEGILPDFNRYSGADSIGSTSELYICRPTRRTRPAAEATAIDPRIYTQGRSAVELESSALPETIIAKVRKSLSETAPPIAYVGPGWPSALTAGGQTPSLNGYLSAISQERGKPAFAGTVAADLHPHFGSYLLRLLLLSAARRLLLCAPEADLRRLLTGRSGRFLRPLVDSVYEAIEILPGDPALAILERIPPPSDRPLPALLRDLIDRRRSRLGNAWREALIRYRQRLDGTRLTKNQARDLIAGSGFPGRHLRHFLSELPISALEALIPAVERTLAATTD